MTELEGLCFDLGVKHEEIPGHNRTLSAFARNLILFFEGRERWPALIERCRELRPEASWPDNDSLPDFGAWDEAAIDDKELENYLGWIQTQYSTIRVLGMAQPLSLETVYTDVFLLGKSENPQKQEIEYLEQAFAGRKDWEQKGNRIQGGELLAQANRFFIVGQPGAGKTTFSKWLALQAARNYVEQQRIPIYLTLRRFNTWDDSLLTLLAHELAFGDIAAATEKLRGLLRQGKLLILLDGLDEVLAEQRDALNDQIVDLAKWNDENQIVITCRPHAETRRFESFDDVRIADFNEDQAERFVRHWFDDSNLANSLLRELKRAEHESIRELTRTPLLLALLCIGYGHEPSFPKRKDQLYKQALQVVLQQWDEERGIRRESIYGQLSLEKKQALLAYVAYATFSQGQLFIAEADLAQHIDDFWQNWRQEEIEHQKVEYGQVYPPELPPKEIVPKDIIRGIAAQHGLLVEQLQDVYSFSHLTLQEYFAALYVVENENQGSVERLMPYVGDDRWRELFLLTASLLNEADANDFFDLFIERLNRMAEAIKPIQQYLKWAEKKAKQACAAMKPAYRMVSLRVWYLARAFAIAQVIVRDHVLTLARDIALDTARDHTLDIARALDLGLDLDLTLALALDIARDPDLGSSLDLDRAIRLCEELGLVDLGGQLVQLEQPTEKSPEAQWETFVLDIQATIDKFRDLWGIAYLRQPWNEKDKQFVNAIKWSQAQLESYIQYLKDIALLIDCLQLAAVSDRAVIEERLLLPAFASA